MSVDERSRARVEALRKIEGKVAKAVDCLWAASEAIAQRSPENRDVELRRLLDHLTEIADLARTP